MFRGKPYIHIFVAVVMMMALLAVSVIPVQASGCTKYHTVKTGEYLVKIGRYYGVTWQYLAKINGIKSPYTLYRGQKICVSTSPQPSPKPPATIPTFTITGVVRNSSVTIETHNFPAHDDYRVLMGPYGTQAINGIHVTNWNSGKGGTGTVTFNIPAGLKGSYRIAVRLQSYSGSGYYAYNWFYNNTTGTGTGSPDGGNGAAKPPKYTGTPVFFITGVVRNNNVTITTHNFPPGLKFDVRMGPMGTRGINGIKVGTLNSGNGGSITATYQIPAALQGSYKISIRTQNWATGYYSYNWFYNNTTK
jgi:LysM repeat protein